MQAPAYCRKITRLYKQLFRNDNNVIKSRTYDKDFAKAQFNLYKQLFRNDNNVIKSRTYDKDFAKAQFNL